MLVSQCVVWSNGNQQAADAGLPDIGPLSSGGMMMANDMATYSRMVLRGAVTALFLFAAFSKLRAPHSFAAYGYPDWFAIVIGAAELAGAIGVWIPKVARLAAFGLILVMIGAAITLVRNDAVRQAVVPLITLFALTRLALEKESQKMDVPGKPLGLD